MKISALRSKARRNTLEVEHILAAAKTRAPEVKDELQRLSREYGWSASTHLEDGTHVVPLAKWAEVAGAYAAEGIEALAPLADAPGDAGYVIGLLEELRSQEALGALITFFSSVMARPATAPETAWLLVKAYNHLLCTKNAVAPSHDQAAQVRSFLARVLAVATSDAQVAWVAYALRGVGDASSIELVSNLKELPYPYESAKADAIQAIRRRQRA